jgi:hypothetical protein
MLVQNELWAQKKHHDPCQLHKQSLARPRPPSLLPLRMHGCGTDKQQMRERRRSSTRKKSWMLLPVPRLQYARGRVHTSSDQRNYFVT